MTTTTFADVAKIDNYHNRRGFNEKKPYAVERNKN